MKKLLSKDLGKLTYFLAGLFFMAPFLMSYRQPAVFVAVFIFLAGWLALVDVMKRAK